MISFALLQGMVPNSNDAHVDNAKKLLYVFCSRARKNLHLISEIGRVNWRGDPFNPTDVLAACPFAYDPIPDEVA